MTNYNHLDINKRESIQYGITNNFSFTKIAKTISVDRTTISKEIKRNSYLKYPNYLPWSETGKKTALNRCEKLRKPPYTCNSCLNKNHCTKPKLYYNAKIANEHYEEIKVNSRVGFDITPEEIDLIEKSIIPLIKNKKQSINQLYSNHRDILYFSKSTCYKYITKGVFSIIDLDLPRKVKYKSRKKNSEDKRKNNAILENRRYKDYLEFIEKNPNFSIIEMDTVIGKREESKCLLTLIIPKTNFMLIRLIEKKSVNGVNTEFEKIKIQLGSELYKKIFRIILTDNGTEFFDVNMFEIDYNTGEKVTNLFYCDPYCSWQKPSVEKNHHHIREVIPKGLSMEELTQENIKELQDHINNIPRDIFNGKTPYELTKKLYPDFIEKLDCKYIKPDDVNRSLLFFKNNEKED